MVFITPNVALAFLTLASASTVHGAHVRKAGSLRPKMSDQPDQRSLSVNGCIKDQADLELALQVVDGSRLILCENNVIEISSTVEIPANTHVALECEKFGCHITSASGFGGTLFQTTPGITSDHDLSFRGVAFVNAGDGVQADANLFDITGGLTKFERKKDRCSFDGNTFQDELIVLRDGTMRFTGCDFLGNVGELEIVRADDSKLLFKDVLFKDNKTQNNQDIADLLDFRTSKVDMKLVEFVSNESDDEIITFPLQKVFSCLRT